MEFMLRNSKNDSERVPTIGVTSVGTRVGTNGTWKEEKKKEYLYLG
jgi:hypothetical protein